MCNKLEHAYKLCFGFNLKDKSKPRAHNVDCSSWYSLLTQWMTEKNKNKAFCVLMVWHEQKNCLIHCNFC